MHELERNSHPTVELGGGCDMLPYFEQPSWHLGPLTIHAFGIVVAIAVWWGVMRARRRFEHLGLASTVGDALVRWMLGGGIVGAHLFAVLFYAPQALSADPWLLFRIWEPISSIGGMLGGLAGALLFFASRPRGAGDPRMLSYVDAVAFVFPAALAVGRFGCTLAHDHPGLLTQAPLAISLRTEAAESYLRGVYAAAGLPLPVIEPTSGFHDLGFYEFLFLSMVVVPAFLYWSRRRRPEGFYLFAFAALYFPVRFGLDMLRVADARYLGLTPGQWTAVVVMALLPFVALRGRKRQRLTGGAVILAAACACWGGS